jgi:MATE family multidrug resistance protein
MHYGTPSSLPSDYAILSRYASPRDDSSDDTHDYNDSNDVQDDTLPHGRTIGRRASFPFPYLNPQQPRLPEHFSSKDTGPDEYTPLLVPRIEEESSTSNGTVKVYRDELRILLKYTLPVLGYAIHLHVALDFG